MQRRLTRLAAASLVAAVCAGTIAIAAAFAVVPPAGTPHLGAMVLEASDFAPGAVVAKRGYVKAPKGAVAEYVALFSAVETSAGAHLVRVGSAIVLTDTVARAKASIAAVHAEFGSGLKRRLFAESIAKQAGLSAAQSREVTVGRPRGIGAGEQSLLVTVVVRSPKRTSSTDIALVRVGDVLGEIVLDANSRLANPVPITLAQTVAARITTVLAGATGASGATGSTGSTGPTGSTG